MSTMPRGKRTPLHICYTTTHSPSGPVCLASTEQGLIRVDFQCGNRPVQPDPIWQEDTAALADAKQQLHAFFQGQRRQFRLPVAPVGTPFQRRVWQELQDIPFGTTLPYRELAQRLGMPGAARAVGHANSRNPLAV